MPTNNAGLDSIFCAAIEIASPEERAAYLDRACGTDDALRQRAQRLVEAHFRNGSFLQGPAMGSTMDVAPIGEKPGMIVGRYKLLQQIGEGGFGVVFMAEQQSPVTRKVALKVIKPGMDSREVIARFEAERQALALMDHPHIAAIYDGGTTESGRPYFVMELVRGIPITQYCEETQLAPRERLELFTTVCQAVQHAHQKGIIHRDLKPSNILVTLHDGLPVVKVIDFGIAKANNQRLTERTLFTRFGGMVGTPLYMSPEQAELSGLDVDIRTDVYALGVLLYELVTGTTPFEKDRLQQAAFDEVRRIIREEDPPRPSVRLSTLESQTRGRTGPFKTAPTRRSKVSGDLDWIVMKAIEKDRNRRYATSREFELDLQRYLDEEPIVARPPSIVYSLGKFTRRHRVRVAVGCLVTCLLVTVGLWLSNVHSRRREAEFAGQLMDFRTMIIDTGALDSSEKLSQAEQVFESLCRSPLSRNPAVAVGGLQIVTSLAKSGRPKQARALLGRIRKDWTVDQLKTLPDRDLKRLTRDLTDCGMRVAKLPLSKARLNCAHEILVYSGALGADVDLCLAWVDVNLERIDDARIAQDKYLHRHIDSDSVWVIRSMILAKSGQAESARDWYLGARESLANLERTLNLPLVSYMRQWARTYRWDPEWPPAGWTEEDTRELFERILGRWPGSAHAQFRLGAWHARQGRWQEARQHYQQALKSGPVAAVMDQRSIRLALAGTLLQVGDTSAYKELCRETLRLSMTEEIDKWTARDVALMLCVLEDSGVRVRDVRQLCEEALHRANENWDGIEWVQGMLDYRSGHWRQAIDNLQGHTGGSELGIAAPFFCAMACHKAGEQDEARACLARAEVAATKYVPCFDGPPSDWYETPMIWSLLQPIRREAHALIDASTVSKE